MATKSRNLKTPLQLWVADNRKRLGLTPRDLAHLTNVTEATARAWESRGGPSEDALLILERRFGVNRPETGSAQEPSGDMAMLVTEIRELVAVLHDSAADRTPAAESLSSLIQGLIAEQVATRAMLERVLSSRAPDAAPTRDADLEAWMARVDERLSLRPSDDAPDTRPARSPVPNGPASRSGSSA